MSCDDLFFRNIDESLAPQNVPILGAEEIRFRFREEIVVVFAQNAFAWNPEQLLAGFVETFETQVDRVLDEQHDWQVFHNGIEKTRYLLQLERCILALGDVPRDAESPN